MVGHWRDVFISNLQRQSEGMAQYVTICEMQFGIKQTSKRKKKKKASDPKSQDQISIWFASKATWRGYPWISKGFLHPTPTSGSCPGCLDASPCLEAFVWRGRGVHEVLLTCKGAHELQITRDFINLLEGSVPWQAENRGQGDLGMKAAWSAGWGVQSPITHLMADPCIWSGGGGGTGWIALSQSMRMRLRSRAQAPENTADLSAGWWAGPRNLKLRPRPLKTGGQGWVWASAPRPSNGHPPHNHHPRKAPWSPLTLNAVATDKAAHCFHRGRIPWNAGFWMSWVKKFLPELWNAGQGPDSWGRSWNNALPVQLSHRGKACKTKQRLKHSRQPGAHDATANQTGGWSRLGEDAYGCKARRDAPKIQQPCLRGRSEDKQNSELKAPAPWISGLIISLVFYHH